MTDTHLEIVGKGEPLVLLHGWGWSNLIWKPLISLISSRYTLYAIDLPGFGKSPMLPMDYSLENISQSILDKVPDNAIWLGWSLGGLIAWWIAIHFPARVKRLITVASSPRFLQDGDWPGMSPDVLEKFCHSLHENQEKTLQHFLHLQLRGSSSTLASEVENLLTPAHPGALKAGLELLKETDLRHDLNKITCPTTHIFGEIDTIVPASIANALQTLAPLSQCHVIKRCGHLPFLSKPFDFIKYFESA